MHFSRYQKVDTPVALADPKPLCGRTRMGHTRPLVLLSNDDGVDSPGLEALEEVFKDFGDIYVVAPDRERNASGHSITLDKPIYVSRLDTHRFAVTGTPTDCINLAVHKLLPRRPDLVISGINKGANLAEDVTYSGTVAGALEACILGIKSFAVSVVSRANFYFNSAALVSFRFALWLLARQMPPGIFFNVNVPNVEPCALGAMKLTRLGRKRYGDVIQRCVDDQGRECFRFGRDHMRFIKEDSPAEETDWNAVKKGFVSVTPLRVNMTDEELLSALRKQWDF